MYSFLLRGIISPWAMYPRHVTFRSVPYSLADAVVFYLDPGLGRGRLSQSFEPYPDYIS